MTTDRWKRYLFKKDKPDGKNQRVFRYDLTDPCKAEEVADRYIPKGMEDLFD